MTDQIPTTTRRIAVCAAPILDEHIDVTIPESWGERLSAVDETGAVRFGPSFRRGVLEALRDVDLFVRRADLESAEWAMLRAEAISGVIAR